MRALADVLIELSAALTGEPEGRERGVLVESARIAVPVEPRMQGGVLLGSLPRNRVATGFDAPLGRLRAVFARGAP